MLNRYFHLLALILLGFTAHATEWVNHYKALGISETASSHEIKQAYRRIALRTHPDINSNDPVKAEEFKRAASAYAVLSDEEKRAAYDRTFKKYSTEDQFTSTRSRTSSSIRPSEQYMMALTKRANVRREQLFRDAVELMEIYFSPRVKPGNAKQALYEVADVWQRLALWTQYNGNNWNVAEAALRAGFSWIKQFENSAPELYQHYFKIGYHYIYSNWLSAKQSKVVLEGTDVFERVLAFADEIQNHQNPVQATPQEVNFHANSQECEVILNGQRVKIVFTINVNFGG